jgi:hypothetical protein
MGACAVTSCEDWSELTMTEEHPVARTRASRKKRAVKRMRWSLKMVFLMIRLSVGCGIT